MTRRDILPEELSVLAALALIAPMFVVGICNYPVVASHPIPEDNV